MSALTAGRQLGQARNSVEDPGTGTAITASRGVTLIAIETGSSGETNTLPDPDYEGLVLALHMTVDGGGDRVITADTALNQAGNNTITFDTVEDYIELRSVKTATAGVYKWKVLVTDGTGILSTV